MVFAVPRLGLRHLSGVPLDGFRSASSSGSSNIWEPEGRVQADSTASRSEANSPAPSVSPTAKTSKTTVSAVFAVAASKADGFSRSDSSERGAFAGDQLADIASDPDFSGFLVLPTVKTAETLSSTVPLSVGRSPLRSRSLAAGDPQSEFGGGPDFSGSPDSPRPAPARVLGGRSRASRRGLIVPSPSSDGTDGWRVLSRRARRFQNEADFHSFAAARRLQKGSLHLKIANVVWQEFIRGQYDVAVFQAVVVQTL